MLIALDCMMIANRSLSMHLSLCQVDAKLAELAARGESAAIDAGLGSTPLAPSVCYRPEGWEAAREAAREAAKEAAGDEADDRWQQEDDDLFSTAPVLLAALERALDTALEAEEPELAAAEEAEGARALSAIELQVIACWLHSIA